ncbi:hypothetical protein GQ44DRAFT_784318 [Phaeosphaeriaceae sp. PMI808]|nr:hypothetical protein GQ44DRAFT_784318 [Phaeosphaeriaceae sp. PMI808]
MFRHFTFDPASTSSHAAYDADRAAMNVSPTTTSSPTTPHADQHPFTHPSTSPCTIGDLASKLNRQSLHIDTKVYRDDSGLLTPPADDNIIEPASAAPQPTYSRVSASLLRMQRQSNSRIQYTSSHLSKISRLVQMMQAEEQCIINQITPTQSGDEGIDMDYDQPDSSIEALISLPQRRACDRPNNGVRVSRGVRMRRRSGNKVEKRRSS